MKSVMIIGMGRLGRHLAKKMLELKNEVMIVDKNSEIIEELAPGFTDAQIADCTNEQVLKSLGINNYDICFVTIGNDFQASLEITSLLKELGAKYVISKARRDIQAKFLLRNGADEVVYPEREIAEKMAIRCSANNIFDCVELSPEFSIFEIPIPTSWTDQSVLSVDVRKKYHINIIAVKRNQDVKTLPGGEYIFKPGDHIIVVGRPADVYRLSSRI